MPLHPIADDIPIAADVAAPAQRVCAERGVVTGHLRDRYGETRTGAGVAASGALIELFVAPTGTWTLIVSRPDGQSCIVSHGDGWDSPPRLGKREHKDS